MHSDSVIVLAGIMQPRAKGYPAALQAFDDGSAADPPWAAVLAIPELWKDLSDIEAKAFAGRR